MELPLAKILPKVFHVLMLMLVLDLSFLCVSKTDVMVFDTRRNHVVMTNNAIVQRVSMELVLEYLRVFLAIQIKQNVTRDYFVVTVDVVLENTFRELPVKEMWME